MSSHQEEQRIFKQLRDRHGAKGQHWRSQLELINTHNPLYKMQVLHGAPPLDNKRMAAVLFYISFQQCCCGFWDGLALLPESLGTLSPNFPPPPSPNEACSEFKFASRLYLESQGSSLRLCGVLFPS